MAKDFIEALEEMQEMREKNPCSICEHSNKHVCDSQHCPYN